MSSGGSKNQTVTNKNEMNPQLEALLFGNRQNQADGILGSARTDFYRGNFQAKNPWARTAADNISGGILSNDYNNSLVSPSIGVAQQYLNPEMWNQSRDRQMSMINGFNTGPNPYIDAQFDSMMKRAGDNIQNRVGGQFNMAGQATSPQAARVASEQMAEAAADVGNQFRMQQYDKDQAMRMGLLDRSLGVEGDAMQRQMAGQTTAMNMAGNLGNQELNDFLMRQQALADAGDVVANQNLEKYNAYARMAGLLSQNPTGGTQTQTSPIYRNRGAGAMGGAMSGAMMGSAFGPIGTGIGAIGGGLLGYMGG